MECDIRGIRQIEPVCLGTSKAGNKILRAWDEEGSSHTAYTGEQPLPGWRLFRLDKILSLKPTGEVYNTPTNTVTPTNTPTNTVTPTSAYGTKLPIGRDTFNLAVTAS